MSCNCEKRVVKVALTGKLRAGKSYASAYLNVRYGFLPFAFGKELKRNFHRLFPKVPQDPKPRHFYQKFGQLMREIDKDVWIDVTLREIDIYTSWKVGQDGEARVLVEDVRQQNELDRLKELGYVIIRVHADDEVRIQRAIEAGDNFTAEDLAHETEVAVDSFEVDYTVTNNGYSSELEAQLDAVMAELGVGKREDLTK